MITWKFDDVQNMFTVTGDPFDVIYLFALMERDGFMISSCDTKTFRIFTLMSAGIDNYRKHIEDQLYIYKMRFDHIKTLYGKK